MKKIKYKLFNYRDWEDTADFLFIYDYLELEVISSKINLKNAVLFKDNIPFRTIVPMNRYIKISTIKKIKEENIVEKGKLNYKSIVDKVFHKIIEDKEGW